jgi:hypothetical protein
VDAPDASSELLRTEFLDQVQSYRDRLAARIAVLGSQQSALDTFLLDARRTARST